MKKRTAELHNFRMSEHTARSPLRRIVVCAMVRPWRNIADSFRMR